MLRRSTRKLVNRLANYSYDPLNRVELYADHLLNNVTILQHQHAGYGIIPVLKANAYGHGLKEVAAILNQADCPFLAVDGYFEAHRILNITKHKVLVMGYIKPSNLHLLDTRHCSFVVQDKEGLLAFGKLKHAVRIHMELNTGMNRMGLQPSEVDGYLDTLEQHPNLILEGIMSHLADADNPSDDRFTYKQVARFDAMVEHIQGRGLEPSYIHLAQTAGSTKARSHYTNALRLGIGLYGINPLTRNDSRHHALDGLQPAMSLKSTIVKVLDLKRGDKVSYNGIFTAPRAMRIGVLPVGYYEGVPRDLSNVGCVLYGIEPLQITGRVCMNHLMVDLGTSAAKVGSEITVISSDPTQPNSVTRLSAEHGLFAYSLLTGVSDSIHRKTIQYSDKNIFGSQRK